MADWIPVREALRRFGLSRATLYRLIGRGTIARAKRAGDTRVYINVADLKRATTLRLVPRGEARPSPAKRRSDRRYARKLRTDSL